MRSELRTIAQQKISLVFTSASDRCGLGAKIECALGRLFPELGRGSDDWGKMCICATEIINNATRKEKQFPVEATLERRGGSLFCTVKQSSPFKNPAIALPQDRLSEHGRGLFMVNLYTERRLYFDGGRGTVSFEYRLAGNGQARRGSMAHRKPIGEKAQ